jgi:hypothetical protein
MKASKRWLVCLAFFVMACWYFFDTPGPTVLSFRIGETFEEVVKNSTYPVLKRSNHPSDDPDKSGQFGATWVTEPAVIIHFNDPQHGFTLPPTKFAALSYSHNKVSTLATSPMLDRLTFDEAVAVLENLQYQFKKGGWEPWTGNESKWFDFTPEGKRRLYEAMFKGGGMESTELRVPNKYAMTFRLWCAAKCATREPPYLFLIDIGISGDTYAQSDDKPAETAPPNK